MNLTKIAILVALSGAGGIVIGYFLHLLLSLQKRHSVEIRIKQILLEAKDKAQRLTEEATKKAETLLETARAEEKSVISQLHKNEERLLQKEDVIERRRVEAERKEKQIEENVLKLKAKKEEVEALEERKKIELEKISSLSEDEARKELFKLIEKRHEDDLLSSMRKLESVRREELEKKAQDILVSTIQRLASSTASETTTTAVPIPSDDIKGKIIGKEGRNIRSLERAAGVEIIVDDTPGSIVISSFDPVRRHIAKIALENLIKDGRIQPARIEEMVEKAKMEIEKIIKERGEAAAYEVGILDLDPRLMSVLGRLHFRTSYGQNVLQHSIEMAHLAGMLASELGADVIISKKGALLHDIGKTMDHEVQGTHVEIGRRILQKFNVGESVVKAMQAHHEEYPYETIESIIVQVADAISGARPGARRDTLENYLKRLEDLERIANSFKGVEKSYAIQAGREIRVFVTPEEVSDLEATKIARDIADRIEEEIKFPGEIKVHVIRESRVVEYAK
ncbi:MAG TPA: ribonuclease Y [Candidatus Paceibacterota bacterium]